MFADRVVGIARGLIVVVRHAHDAPELVEREAVRARPVVHFDQLSVFVVREHRLFSLGGAAACFIIIIQHVNKVFRVVAI